MVLLRLVVALQLLAHPVAAMACVLCRSGAACPPGDEACVTEAEAWLCPEEPCDDCSSCCGPCPGEAAAQPAGEPVRCPIRSCCPCDAACLPCLPLTSEPPKPVRTIVEILAASSVAGLQPAAIPVALLPACGPADAACGAPSRPQLGVWLN